MDKKNYNIRYFTCLWFFLCLGKLAFSFNGKHPIQSFTSATYKAGIQNIDFAQNRNMTLFVANNLGVLSFNGNDWEVHPSKAGKKIRSLAFDEKSDRLYVGSQGEFGYFNADWQFVSLLEKIPTNARYFDEVWEVFLFNDKVYFCTIQGIYVYDGQSIDVIEQEGGFNRSFHANGKLFTQSQQGNLFEIKGLTLVPAPIQNKLTIASIIPQEEGYLLFYNSGEIELSTPFGISEKYDHLVNALQGRFVNHVLQLSDTRLAITTQTSGVFLYDIQNQNLENITEQDGLPTNACLSSFQDYAGNLWVGTQIIKK